ncbi:MAG: energy transducer TonB [Thermodesulfovibrionales bacterium]|jgi:protein TonB|nr:energy transducer TonB [Thermodesulfovibrionales bacterium]
MTYQSKGLQFSLILHAVVFAFIIAFSSSIVPINKPIVIDFNIEDSADALKEKPKELPAPKTRPVARSLKQEVKEQKKEIEKPTPVADVHPIPITEAQVSIPSVQPRTEQVVAKNEGHTIASSRTDRSSGDKKGIDGASGNSEEKARMRYLKEHFAYIRDTIMKNLSYPHMARRMGWAGKVTVSFVVCENGYVENLKILETSGIGLLDKNAMGTIKKVMPFPKPPVRAELIMPIVYRLE